ncbi:MAG: hypothetical protein AAF288_02080 [Planctomycetota bacterium]
MHIFAEDNDIRLPGVTPEGNIGSIGAGHGLEAFGNWQPGEERMAVGGQTGSGDNPAVRFAILAQGDYFATDGDLSLLVSVVENGKSDHPKREWDNTEPLSAWHYAWAMAALGGQPTDRDTAYTPPNLNVQEGHYGKVSPRAAAWAHVENADQASETPFVSSRNPGSDNIRDRSGGPSLTGLYDKSKYGGQQEWLGVIGFADGHVKLVETPYLDRTNFSTANAASGSDGRTGDNLFYLGDANNRGATDHNTDAVMVYPTAGDGSGNPTLGVINQW